jgi:hypothetical protein
MCFFAAVVIQEEYPNRLLLNGAKRDLRKILEANERSRKVMASECYDVLAAVSDGDLVGLDVKSRTKSIRGKRVSNCGRVGVPWRR